MNARRLFVYVATVASLILPATVYGQAAQSALTGVVKDATGGVLPGVTVEATIAGGAPLTTVTDAKGVYRFPALAPGKYVVKSTLSGFAPAKTDSVTVNIGVLLTVDLTMTPGGMTESVEVKAESPVIDVKQSAVTQVIDSTTMDLIPKNGTGILGVLVGLPGAGVEGRTGGFGIDGAGASENRYIIDGMLTSIASESCGAAYVSRSIPRSVIGTGHLSISPIAAFRSFGMGIFTGSVVAAVANSLRARTVESGQFTAT